MKPRKATPIDAWTDKTLAFNVGGRCIPNCATANPNSASIKTQRIIEPSWFPQTPLILYNNGFKECEFSATLITEKSEVT